MDKPIETAGSLYREIRNKGLHLRNGYGRDDALISELAKRLKCPDTNLQRYLDNSNISAQDFLIEFIGVSQPFAMMFSEIWDYVSVYTGDSFSESIAIRFGFPDSTDQTVINLEQFRRYVEEIGKIISITRIWTKKAIYQLYGLYRILLREGFDGRIKNIYKEGDPFSLPKIIVKDHPFDHIAASINNLFQTNIDAFVKKSRLDIFEHEFKYKDEELVNNEKLTFPTRCLTADLLPFWIEVFDMYDCISDETKNMAMEFYEKQIKSLLDREKRVRIGTLKKGINIIDLPFWRHRWHIYEIWGTIITLQGLKEYRPVLRIKNNMLPFDAYNPAIIADLKTKDYKKACVSMQVTTPYKTPTRTAIKPDLRVCFSHEFVPNNSAVIVEFKQRLKMTKQHVLDVATAYNNGSPKAKGVIILNYDNFNEEVKLPGGCKILSDVHPSNKAALDEFKNALLNASQRALLLPKLENIAILLDVSASMRGHYRKESISLLHNLIRNNGMQVFAFNDGLISNKSMRDTDCTDLITSGGTYLGKALEQLEHLCGLPQRLLIVTDGEFERPTEILSMIPKVKECMPQNINNYINWLLA